MVSESSDISHKLPLQTPSIVEKRQIKSTDGVTPNISPSHLEPLSSSFSGGATPVQAGKVREATRFLWEPIKMGLDNVVKLIKKVELPKVDSGAISRAFANISTTFSKWQTQREVKQLLKAAHTITEGGLKNDHRTPSSQRTAPVQGLTDKALDDWKRLRKLQNVDEVLSQCQSGKMKPQVIDGELVAVERSLVGVGKTGQSEETREAMFYIMDAIRDGAAHGVTVWSEGGKHYNLADTMNQLTIASKNLSWDKSNPRMKEVLHDLQQKVNEAVPVNAQKDALIDRLKNISKYSMIASVKIKSPALVRMENSQVSI